MRILLLGGSNTGLSYGWSSTLRELAPEHVFENAFLGGVGSLFGFVQLLRFRAQGAPKPDLIVVEYALNDTILFIGFNLLPASIEAGLDDLITLCARDRIPLLFLNLSLRPAESDGETEASRFINDIYARKARERGMARCLDLVDILGDIRRDDYVDPFHLAPEPSRRVAEAVVARLSDRAPVPNGADRLLSHVWLEAARARTLGPARLLTRASPVFTGQFLQLARGGSSEWPERGRLAALMIYSIETSGRYRIRSGGLTVVKNAHSETRTLVPELMVLHYVTTLLPKARSTTIDMPADPAALEGQFNDATLMECEPPAGFADQTVDIGGVVLFRTPTRLDRLFARLGLWKIGAGWR